jgi:hypothetical protein
MVASTTELELCNTLIDSCVSTEETLMTRFHVVLLIGVMIAMTGGDAFAQERPSVFVGPLIRDGFADVDSGIRDSIRDIQQVLRNVFPMVNTREQAKIVLTVLARGIVTNGSVGINTSSVIGGTGSGFGFVVPNTTPTLTTLISVGSYERRMQSESGTWRGAAEAVVVDLAAWVEANQKALSLKAQ